MAFVPAFGLLTLAIFIGFILFLEGLFEILFALALKPFSGWKWMMLSGVLALSLSFFVMIGFPDVTMLFLAIVVGLNMGTYGMSVLLLALGRKKFSE